MPDMPTPDDIAAGVPEDPNAPVGDYGKTIGYRVVTDEPQGVTIGFEPPKGVDYDVFEIVSDDGGDNVFVTGDGNMIISSEQEMGGQYPEPDLMVWRSPEEFNEWYRETMEPLPPPGAQGMEPPSPPRRERPPTGSVG